MICVFGDYALDTHLYELRYHGERRPLGPQVFNTLAYLIAHRDRVVAKEELFEHVWPNQIVSDATLHQHVTAARRAIGDSGQRQHIIKTLRGRGYRFIAHVEVYGDEASDREPASVMPTATPSATGSGPTPPPLESTLAHALTSERKLVTVLYGTLSNTVALAESLGLEALPRLRQSVYDLAQQAIQPYHGALQPMEDDGFLALFGIPSAQEDHARRALLAGLALQRCFGALHTDAVLRRQVAFDVRLGVHTGTVMAGTDSSDPQRPAIVVGDVMTVVAQLQHRAGSGMLLSTEDTLRLTPGEVDCEAYETIVIPGRSAPLRLYTVQAVGPGQTSAVLRSTRILSDFVGRDREMGALQALLAQVAQGQGQVVGIIGEPGMGKSRLLYEFAQHLAEESATYIEGHCSSYGRGTPYLPVLDLLRQLCGITDADNSETATAKVYRCLEGMDTDAAADAPYLLDFLGLLSDRATLALDSPQEIKHRTFSTLRRLIAQHSQRQPLVLAVENLHWMDPTSEEWFVSLVESLKAIPLLLLLTYRPGYRPVWMGRSYATQVALARLTPTESLLVVQSASRMRSLADVFIQEILMKADGNPFFLEELTRAVIGRDEASTTLSTFHIPETVYAVLAARVDTLPSAQKRLLQIASVIGADVPVSLLQAITEMPRAALDQDLEQLQRLEFLYVLRGDPEVVYTFQHALIQDVVYASLVLLTRQQVHERVARALSECFPMTVENQPERLAHHYTEAGCHAQSVTYWQRAGQQAVERAAYIEAVDHFRSGLKALSLLLHSPERTQQEAQIQIALGNALIATNGWGSADVEHVFLRAYELCRQVEENTQLCIVLNRLCNFYAVKGSIETAQAYGAQLLSLAQRLDNAEWLGIGHASFGEVLLNLGAFAPAREHLTQARAFLLSQSIHYFGGDFDRDHGRIRSHTMMMRSLWTLGYPDQALSIMHEGLVWAQRLGRPFILAIMRSYAATLHTLRGDWKQVQREAEAVLALATEHGFPQWTGAGTLQRGWAIAVQGRVEDGIEQMRQGLIAARMAGSEVAHAGRITTLVGIYSNRQLGRAIEGLQLLDEAQAIVHATGGRIFEAELYRLRGELLLQRSSATFNKAERCFHQALDIARNQEAKSWELRAATSLSRLWRDQNKRDQARELLAPIYGWFTEGFDTVDLQNAKALLKELAE